MILNFYLVACGRALMPPLLALPHCVPGPWPARFATCSVRIVVTVSFNSNRYYIESFYPISSTSRFRGSALFWRTSCTCHVFPIHSWQIVITRARKIVQKREKWLRILTPPSAWMLCRSFGQTGFSLLSKENKFLPLIYIDKNITVFVSLRIDFFWRCGNSSSSLTYWPIHIQSNPIQASFYCISSSCFREPMNFVHMQSSSSAVIVDSI